MLTSLSFLDKGQPWPPECERERLNRYAKNKDLFEGDHGEVYIEDFKRIERVIGNFNDVICYPVIINYQKKISLKTADFLWVEPPKIKAGESKSKEQTAVDKICANSDLVNMGYENTIDISRYGDGILMVYKDGDHGVIDVTQPSIWFPVVDPMNIKRTQYHVLAWVAGDENKQLTVQIHEKGKYTERIYKIDDPKDRPLSLDMKHETIGDMIGNEKIVLTGLSDFAILQASNIITSDRCYGFDDYTDVDSIVSEILIRIAQISKVLDKHAEPSVQGPISALEKDPITGQWQLKMGNYFAMDDKDSAPVEYITWNGQLESSFTQIEKLINMLGVMSEMGSAIFDNAEGTKEAASGTAIRLRYMTLLSKVKRISLRYSPVIIKAIKLCSELGGKDIVRLTDSNINITWQDGLPNDDKERADIMNIRTGQKATISQIDAIMALDDVDEETAQQKLDRILEDDAMSVPTGFNETPSVETPEE